MAIGDHNYREVDSLILSPKLYFPLEIYIAHFQLRHYISCAEEPNVVYYAHLHNVYSLNIETKSRKRLATLPFEAQCTASGHGYICIGGNVVDGSTNIAVVNLASAVEHDAAEVDEQLPLYLGSHASVRDAKPTANTSVNYAAIGTQIVNSISIHKLQGSDYEDADVVAVLTNNDSTVRVFSLDQLRELTCLNHPFEMNHASISPDGNRLVAVGDSRRAFFYEKVAANAPSAANSKSRKRADLNWTLIATVDLHCPASREDVGYFTSAWSSLSNLCAVGSECGYITVFDIDVLQITNNTEEATVRVIKSSRQESGPGPGSIRTLLFAPYPLDLLIWGEDQGRVCVTDLRTGLLTRQILHLESDVERKQVDIVDDISNDDLVPGFEPELESPSHIASEFDALRRFQRSLASGDALAPLNFAELSPEGQRLLTRAGVVESNDDPNGLTPEERRLIEAIRPSRTSDSDNHSITPRSINYALGRQSSRSDQNMEAGLLSRILPSMGSYGHLMREQGVESERRRFPEPRRQASIMLAGQSASTARASAPRSVPGTLDHHFDLPSAHTSADIAAQRERLLRAELRQRTTIHPSPEQTMNELRRLRSVSQRYEALIQRQTTTAPAFNRALGARTAGLAMSHDGRQIYVGADDGIYVYDINVKGRRMCPAQHPR